MADSKKEGLMVQAPSVYITPDAMNKMDFYLSLVPGEISGVGVVEQVDAKTFVIEELYIFPQESSSGGTEYSGTDLGVGVSQLISQGVDPTKLKLWWHSHGRMSAFWSPTDEENIEETYSGEDWFISIVGNKSGDYRVRFDMYRPARLMIDNVDLKIWDSGVKVCNAVDCFENFEVPKDTKEVRAYCDAHQDLYLALKTEVNEKVQEPTPSWKSNGSKSDSKTLVPVTKYHHYDGLDDDWGEYPGKGFGLQEFSSHQSNRPSKDHWIFCSNRACTNKVQFKDDQRMIAAICEDCAKEGFLLCAYDKCDEVAEHKEKYCEYHEDMVAYVQKHFREIEQQSSGDTSKEEIVEICIEMYEATFWGGGYQEDDDDTEDKLRLIT